MQVQKDSGDELNRLLGISNEIAKAFKQPPLYAEDISSAIDEDSAELGQFAHATAQKQLPSDKDQDMSSSFHISIGWTLSAPSRDTSPKLNSVLEKETTNFRVFVEILKCKIGNSITAVPLTSKISALSGAMGT